MDIIQKTVALFSDLLQKFVTVGDLLKYNCLPVLDGVEKKRSIFWVFDM